MTMRIGFVDLGAMGMPMACNLAAGGHPVTGYDLALSAGDAAAESAGIEIAASVAGAARAADVLFTCLPNDAIVEATYLGPDGIADAIPGGAVTIDCSTISPQTTVRVSEHLAERNVHHLDASMLGSVPQAQSGEIGFVVGGDRGAFERVTPLLYILGRFKAYAGGSGAANRIKLIHQTLAANNAVAVAEAVALCLATDTDLDCFYDVVVGGGGMGQSRYFERRVPRMRDGDFSPLFMLDLMVKDTRLARDLAASADAEMPLLDTVVRRFEEAQDQGWGAEDFSSVAHLYEKMIGRPFADG